MIYIKDLPFDRNSRCSRTIYPAFSKSPYFLDIFKLKRGYHVYVASPDFKGYLFLEHVHGNDTLCSIMNRVFASVNI